MVGVSASVNLPLHHKVQEFSSGTGSPGWSRIKGRKTVVVWCPGRNAKYYDPRVHMSVSSFPCPNYTKFSADLYILPVLWILSYSSS